MGFNSGLKGLNKDDEMVVMENLKWNLRDA